MYNIETYTQNMFDSDWEVYTSKNKSYPICHYKPRLTLMIGAYIYLLEILSVDTVI